MNRWLILPIAMVLLSLGGCATSESEALGDANLVLPEPEITETTEPPIEENPKPDASPPDSEDTTFLISRDGIGAAHLGMSFGELKDAMGDGVEYTVESPFIVDFDAIAVRQSGELLFYILYLAGESFTDENIIQGLMTTNPAYKTQEGVGVGTPLNEAEEIYGDATLSYSLSNESREYVRFDNHPSGNLAFGMHGKEATSTDYAGVYADPTMEYNETQEYVEGATIQTILVVCTTEACAS